MPQYCCVPTCTNTGGHRFPKNESLKLKWRVAIKRIDPVSKKLWVPGPLDVVCRLHFKETDYVPTIMGARRILRQGAVPSLFSFKPRGSERSGTIYMQRDKVTADVNDVQNEVIISCENTEEESVVVDDDQEVLDCPVLGNFSIEKLQYEPKKVQYYTSFQDYDHFMFVYHCLGPAVDHLSYKSASLLPKDELFLTLIKLRQAKEDTELSFYFSISETTVSRIIVTWINFLYFQLKEINIWPSRQVVDQHMPTDFARKFQKTRVILDATEVPIQKPSHVDSQCATWSSYKHRNTLKTMIGCTPRGTVSFISDSYGGSASDRQIVERSELVQPEMNKFARKDSIMADRGIMVQDLFATQDVFVNTPTMLKGKSQLEPEEVVRDRRVASKRIHVERVIGLAKTFKILRNPLPPSKVILGSRITYVCFSLVNFRPSIVSQIS